MKLVRYFWIIILFVGNFSFSQLTIQQKLDDFTKYSGFANAGISIQAIDCATGAEIASINKNMAMAPASTVKLFSTASALELLGAEYMPNTQIFYEGTISKDSILNGNIWIVGLGDMTLGSKYFNSPETQSKFLTDWCNAIKKAGINKIDGSIIADGSKFGYEGVPDGWNWSDMGNYYGAGFSGLCIYDNIINYHFKTSSVGKPAELISTFPIVENLIFQNYIQSANVNGDNSYIYGAPFANVRFATGSLPVNQSNFVVKGSLPDPEYQLANEFHQYLISKGIIVSKMPSCARITGNFSKGKNLLLILDYKGKSILEIATLTNHKSINLFAEGLLCNIGYHLTGNGSTSSSISSIENYWAKKMTITGLNIKDGSGLSRTNGVSSAHFCQLLKAMYNSKNYKTFFNTLPVAGVSGTLSSICKGQVAEGKMHAKSGTMSRIKSYAGYIESTSGKTIAFAVIINNYESSNSATVDQMEKIFNALAVY